MSADASPATHGETGDDAAAARRHVPPERRILTHDHRAIERVVDRIEATAEITCTLGAGDLASTLRSLLDAAERSLEQHLAWEETVCYPQIDQLAATAWATRILRFQHDQLRRAVEVLEADWRSLQREEVVAHDRFVLVRTHLYRLHALMSAHLEQEEVAVIPFLEAGCKPL